MAIERDVSVRFLGDAKQLAQEAERVKKRLQDLGKTQVALIETQVAKGQITEAEGRKRTLQAERVLTQQLLSELTNRAEVLNSTPISLTFTAENQEDALLKVDQEAAQLRAGLAKKEKEARVKAETDALDAVKKTQQQALDQVKLAEQGRLIAVQSAVNQALITEEQAKVQRLDIRKQGFQEELAANQNQLTRLEALPKSSDPELEKKRQAEIREARSQTTALTLQLLENEAAKQKALQEQIIKGIEDQEATQKRASDAQAAQLEKEKAAQDVILSTLERRNKLEESRVSLKKAQGNLEQTQTQIELESITRAQEIRGELDDKTVESATVRAQLEQELAELTGSAGTSELEILQRKQVLEDQLSVQRLAALDAEQAAQRASLEFEIQRNALIAQRGVLEARLAEVQSRQKIAGAEFELQKALVDGDQTRIANAQQLVQLTREAAQISQELVKGAQANAGQQRELAVNQRKSLKLEQQGVREKAQSSDRLRNFKQDMELVKAGGRPQSQVSSNGAINAGDLPASFAPFNAGISAADLLKTDLKALESTDPLRVPFKFVQAEGQDLVESLKEQLEKSGTKNLPFEPLDPGGIKKGKSTLPESLAASVPCAPVFGEAPSAKFELKAETLAERLLRLIEGSDRDLPNGSSHPIALPSPDQIKSRGIQLQGPSDRNRDQVLEVAQTRGANIMDVREAKGGTSAFAQVTAKTFVDLKEFIQDQLGKGAQIVLPSVREQLNLNNPPPLPGAVQLEPKQKALQDNAELVKQLVSQINVAQRPIQVSLVQNFDPSERGQVANRTREDVMKALGEVLDA